MRILRFLIKPVAIAFYLKGSAYLCTSLAFIFPKLSFLFVGAAIVTGTAFYVVVGGSAGGFLARKLRVWKSRLGKDCLVGCMDQDDNPIVCPKKWP